MTIQPVVVNDVTNQWLMFLGEISFCCFVRNLIWLNSQKHRPFFIYRVFMNEVIVLNGINIDSLLVNEDGVQMVNARKLHEALEIGRDFSTWINNRLDEYGLKIGSGTLPKTGDAPFMGKPDVNYYLTFDVTKFLCMIEKTEKGRDFCKRFIQWENKLKDELVIQIEKNNILVKNFSKIIDNYSKTIDDFSKRIITLESTVFPKFLEPEYIKIDERIIKLFTSLFVNYHFLNHFFADTYYDEKRIVELLIPYLRVLISHHIKTWNIPQYLNYHPHIMEDMRNELVMYGLFEYDHNCKRYTKGKTTNMILESLLKLNIEERQKLKIDYHDFVKSTKRERFYIIDK